MELQTDEHPPSLRSVDCSRLSSKMLARRMPDVQRIAEDYFQRLLRGEDVISSVGALIREWSPRVDMSLPRWGLSRTEYQVQLCAIYTVEVGNGGHSQFFSNRGGAIAFLVISALREVALSSLARILERAVTVFPGGIVPAEPDDVGEVLDALSPDQESRLDGLDREAFDLFEGVDAALLTYMRTNARDVLCEERGISACPG